MDLDTFIFATSIAIPLFTFLLFRKQLENNTQWFIIGGGIVTIIGYIYIYIYIYIYKYYRR